MPIIKRKAESREMRKHYNVVKNMSGGMKFDENMVNVNWKRVRMISDIGYSFMPKEKGVKFKKVSLDGVNAVMSVPKEIVPAGGVYLRRSRDAQKPVVRHVRKIRAGRRRRRALRL